MHKINMKNQSGIAQILVLLLLIAGIGIGAYLIKQRTNIFPHAENNAQRIDTGSCRDNPDDAKVKVDALNNSQTGNQNFYYKWQAFCSISCSQNSDCPQNQDDPDRVNPNSSNWCFGFGDGSNKCLKLVAINKSDNQPATTTTGKNPTSGSSTGNATSNGTSNASVGTGNASACTNTQLQNIAKTYYDAKVAQRYARYTAIIKGAKEYCVQADLGVEPGIRRDSEDGVVKNGRLNLCSRADNSESALKLVWRVISDDAKNIRALTIKDDNVTLNDVNGIMGKNIAEAKKALGL